jgi:hypothetical protein
VQGIPIMGGLRVAAAVAGLLVLACVAEAGGCKKGDVVCFCKASGGIYINAGSSVLQAGCKISISHQGELSSADTGNSGCQFSNSIGIGICFNATLHASTQPLLYAAH